MSNILSSDLVHFLTGRQGDDPRRLPPHLHSASKGGKVPGIPRKNRKYPDGKTRDEKTPDVAPQTNPQGPSA